MAHLFQEYFASLATGKSTQFIPFQIEQNKALGCKRFLVVAKDDIISLHDSYVQNRFTKPYINKNRLNSFFTRLWDSLLGKFGKTINPGGAIEVFDISPWLTTINTSKKEMNEAILKFLEKSDLSTNIIIDEVRLLFKDNQELVNELYRVKSQVLTFVGQPNLYNQSFAWPTDLNSFKELEGMKIGNLTISK